MDHAPCMLDKQSSRAHAYAYAHESGDTRTHAPYRAPYTHAQKYEMFIAFARQQWFLERASMLRYTKIAFFCNLRTENL